jgi:hypothetical protein
MPTERTITTYFFNINIQYTNLGYFRVNSEELVGKIKIFPANISPASRILDSSGLKIERILLLQFKSHETLDGLRIRG